MFLCGGGLLAALIKLLLKLGDLLCVIAPRIAEPGEIVFQILRRLLACCQLLLQGCQRFLFFGSAAGQFRNLFLRGLCLLAALVQLLLKLGIFLDNVVFLSVYFRDLLFCVLPGFFDLRNLRLLLRSLLFSLVLSRQQCFVLTFKTLQLIFSVIHSQLTKGELL